MLQKIKDLFVVLQVGRQFKNAAFWKNFSGAWNGVLIVIAFLLTFLPNFQISQEALQIISMAIAYIADVLINNQLVTPEMVKTVIAAAAALIWALFNNYFNYATSAKVGLPSISDKPAESKHMSTIASEDWRDEILHTNHLSDAAFAEPAGVPVIPDESRESDQPVQANSSLDSGKKLLGG